MNILVVSENFYPDTFAVNDVVRILVERGHRVTVLTGLPDYTTSEIPEEYKRGRNRRQDYCGAEVLRVPTIARGYGRFRRSLCYLSFVANGSITAIFHKWNTFDIIYVWEVSPVTMAIPAMLLKRRYQKPLFLYCMDIWPECVKAMGFREGGVLFALIRRLSAWIYRSCDHIAVSSRPFFDYLERVDGCDRKRMSYLPQFGAAELLEADLSKNTAERARDAKAQGRENQNNAVDFLFVGNIGKAQGLDCLVHAAAALRHKENVTIHMVGGGSDYKRIRRLAKVSGADRIIRFYGPKPFEETKAFYKKADACLITLDGSTRIGDTLPGKLQTYMAAGKPVLGAMNGAGREIIEESGCGRCVSAGDSRGLARLLTEYIAHPERFTACGEKGRTYFRAHFTQEAHFTRLEEILRRMIAAREATNPSAKRQDRGRTADET